MKYTAPEGVTSINVGGEQFDVAEDRTITVPDGGNYAVQVVAHGFVPFVEPRASRGKKTAGDVPAPVVEEAPADIAEPAPEA